MWTEENRTACVMELLANLHNALTKKYLRHFFITRCNLFDIEYFETPQVLDSLAVKVEQFMTNPMEFSRGLIPTQGTRRSDVVTSRTNKEEQEDVEASIEDTLPSGDPKCGQLAAKDEENEAWTSSQEESTRKMTGTVKEAIAMHGSRETGVATLQGARFHDMKDLYHQTCLDLLAIAVEDRSMDELDPLEKSLVEDMKELTREYKLHPETLLEQLKGRWQSCTFIRMILNSEFCTKQSMLAAMKNDMKLIKLMVLQDGFLGSPRDYSLIVPSDVLVNGYRRWKRILSSMEPKKPISKMEDIPLD
ncbi:hypothetical protein OS493_031437 [Desmophyllum pertusum]|uniref:Mab-21-like HhH/H2TH-like domain-containing protein n=1 Tax=Desmophyllum pertusum TaxID=174260 RepID=A0A9W9ZYM5_9CNID|nr:hypothetical protein OS493_031437 [Desmophyllum pertusum]